MAIVNFRTDPDTDAALAELQADGTDRSAAIRQALLYAARQHRRERIRKEAERIAADPDDRAEIERVQEDMAPYRAW